MKQLFICAAALGLFLVACKKDDSAPTPTEPVVKKYIQSIIGESDSTAIEYNIDKSVYRFYNVSYGDYITISMPTYEAGKMTGVENDENGDSYHEREISYNSTGKVSALAWYFSDGALDHSYKMTYNGDGKLDSIYDYTTTGIPSVFHLERLYAFTWDTKGNIIRMESVNPDNSAVSRVSSVFTYDDKINPAANTVGYYLMHYYTDELPFLISANNLLTSTTTADPSYSDNSVETYTYKYDADNYPVVYTWKSYDVSTPANVDSTTYKINYGK